MSKKLFVVLSIQRSGSTYLQQWLNHHQDIRCHDEILLPHHGSSECFGRYLKESRFAGFTSNRFAKGKKLWDPISAGFLRRFLDNLTSDRPYAVPSSDYRPNTELTDTSFRCQADWVGFKLMANQMPLFRGLVEDLQGRDVHVIRILRENLLEIYISRLVAEARGVYHSSDRQKPVSLELRIDKTLANLKHMKDEIEYSWDAFKTSPRISVSYSALFSEDQQDLKMRQVLDFLGTEAEPLPEKPSLKKVINQPIHEVVKNYDEIVAAIVANGYNQNGVPNEMCER